MVVEAPGEQSGFLQLDILMHFRKVTALSAAHLLLETQQSNFFGISQPEISGKEIKGVGQHRFSLCIPQWFQQAAFQHLHMIQLQSPRYSKSRNDTC